jgi:heme-degrading monooxygenase HmoA
MAIKILIKRRVPQSKVKELIPYLLKLRTLAMNQAGYIGGETLKRLDDPEESLVISTWQSIEAWKEWLMAKERSEIQEQIDSLLGEKTVYSIYGYS